MANSTGINKKKIAVFISGTGTNLKSLVKYSNLNKANYNIVLVISNNKKAKGLAFAKLNKINYQIINYKYKNKAEKKILLLLKKYEIKIICLAGFMKIISSSFIKKFKGKIINIHPSLLPKYKGLNTHERVIKNNEKYSGFTIHLVNKKLDSGKIIFQKKIKVLKTDNQKTLQKKILIYENKYYPIILSKYLFNL